MGVTDDAASLWYDLVGDDEELRTHYSELRQTLSRTVAADAEAAAAVFVDGRPCVLAIGGGGLFVVRLEDAESSPWSVERLPLSNAIAVRIQDRWHTGRPGGRQSATPALLRGWTLRWPDGPTLTLETMIHRGPSFGSEGYAAEQFMRKVAVAIGWTLPEAN